MNAGTGMAEDPSGPRLTTELMRMNRTIGELASAQVATKERVDEIHRAIFVGNHNPGIVQWLMKHDSQLARLTGQRLAANRHTIKVASFGSLGLGALVLALKLAAYLITGHWPIVP